MRSRRDKIFEEIALEIAEIFDELKHATEKSKADFELAWNGLTFIQQQRLILHYPMLFKRASKHRR